MWLIEREGDRDTVNRRVAVREREPWRCVYCSYEPDPASDIVRVLDSLVDL
jgi:hypothetical protein